MTTVDRGSIIVQQMFRTMTRFPGDACNSIRISQLLMDGNNGLWMHTDVYRGYWPDCYIGTFYGVSIEQTVEQL